MSNAPSYPDPFFNILGIQDQERVISVGFTQSQYVQEWSGQELSYREIHVKKLLELLPHDWWFSLNPGCEFGKDFSPWELAELQKGGVEAIPSVLHENFHEEFVTPIQVEPLKDGEHNSLQQALIEHLPLLPGVQRLFLVKEIGINIDGEPQETLLLGIQCHSSERKQAHAELRSIAERELIGGIPLKVFAEESISSLALSIFSKYKPFYEKKSQSFLARFFSYLLKKHNS